MPKHKEYNVILISTGQIVSELHYGPNCHNWWLLRPTDKTNNPALLYPIRLYMKTLIILQEHDFITEVVEVESEYGPAPGYICKCEGIQSEISQSLTVAISSVYQKIVNKETKFSGPAVMGFDTPIISEILIQDIPFQAYVVSLEKLRIWILCIGRPNKSEWNFAGTGYKAAFIYTYKKNDVYFLKNLMIMNANSQSIANKQLLKILLLILILIHYGNI